MNVLIIFDGPAYGSELPFDARRVAGTLAKRDGVEVRVLAMGGAVVWTLEADQIVTF